MTDPIKSVVSFDRELFAYLESFFLQAIGTSAERFATVETFGDAIRSNAVELAPRVEAALRWLDTEVRAFYARRGFDVFEPAAQLGGMNLVLGGGSRFRRSQLSSVLTAALYSDTVFVPDPVLPWLERDRQEEKFRSVLLLQAVHTLLQLKPLVDADLPYPAVVVFPSWEKLLEEGDSQTQGDINQLLTDVVSFCLGEDLESVDEVIRFVDRHPERFVRAVDRSRLFIAPGGALDETVEQALRRYDEEMAKWRSPAWLESHHQRPTHQRLLNGIWERIAPIHHLLENAAELNGHPLMCLEQHAHYFRLVSRASSLRLTRLRSVDPRTTALVDALGSRRFRWLGGIPADVLARLRRDNENAAFRNRLVASVARLHDSTIGDVDKVAAEVCHEIESAIAEHERDLRAIQEKYNRIHGQTVSWGLAAVGAAIMPALAPLLGTAVPLALATKYAHDKRAELADKRTLTRSMVGVLAAARSQDYDTDS